MRSVVTLVAAVLVTGAALHAQDAKPIWSHLPLDGDVVVATLSLPESPCQAAATKTTLYVADATGSVLWQWRFRDTNRFIHVAHGSAIVLSPDCRTAVLAGNVAYKYVWAVDRDGRTRVLPTIGTPLHTAFSLDGATVAVVTGATRGYLLTPTLTVTWSGRTSRLPVRWPSQVGGIGEGRTTFAQTEVERLLGARMWGWGVGDDVSDDGQWRVLREQEPRGHGPGTIAFFGPNAGGYHGRLLALTPRWTRAVGCPGGTVSIDGEFVVVEGNFRDPDDQMCETSNVATMVFDRDGKVIASMRGFLSTDSPEADDLAAAVLKATGKPLRLKGQ